VSYVKYHVSIYGLFFVLSILWHISGSWDHPQAILATIWPPGTTSRLQSVSLSTAQERDMRKLKQSQSQSQSYVMTDRHRPVRPGVRHPSGNSDQFFPFSLWLFFWQFRVCWCGAPPLTRSRICTFQFLPGIASAAFLRSESHWTNEHSLLSLFLDSPNQKGQVPVFISPRNRVVQLCPRALGLSN
jgi:hypothetical protein